MCSANSPRSSGTSTKNIISIARNAPSISRRSRLLPTPRGNKLLRELALPLAKELVPARGGWLRWLQPALVPACAALLLLVGYQNFVSIPHWKGLAVESALLAVEAVQVAAPQVLPVFSLLGSNRRGGARPVFHAKAGESFALKVDIPDTDSSALSSYVLRLDDGSGAARVLSTVSRDEARNTVFMEGPVGFPSGNARLVVVATPPPGPGARTAREITSIPFEVAIGADIDHHP